MEELRENYEKEKEKLDGMMPEKQQETADGKVKGLRIAEQPPLCKHTGRPRFCLDNKKLMKQKGDFKFIKTAGYIKKLK